MTTGQVLDLQTTDLMRDLGTAPIRTLADAERAHIIAALQETSWVIGGRRGAAAQLGLARTSLIASMKRLGIPREQAGQPARSRFGRFRFA